MNKPITLVWQEFADSLRELINNTILPAFIIEYTLNDMTEEVHRAAQIQMSNDRQAYEAAVASAAENTQLN